MTQDREQIVSRLNQDLIGPFSDDEVLQDRPSDVYLTGILWPAKTEMTAEEDESMGAQPGEGNESDSGEDEQVPPSGQMRPSAAGLSFAVENSGGVPEIEAEVRFATYEALDEEDGNRKGVVRPSWRRRPWSLTLPLRCDRESKTDLGKRGSLSDVWIDVRSVPWGNKFLITATLINRLQPREEGRRATESVTLFQTHVIVRALGNTRLVPRPSRRAITDDDDRSTALLYRSVCEFAVGHTSSAAWDTGEGGIAQSIATAWIPRAEVPATSSIGHKVFEPLRKHPKLKAFDASWLSQATDDELRDSLAMLPAAYRSWIEQQERSISKLDDVYKEQAERNVAVCRGVRERIVAGVSRVCEDDSLRVAFKLANRAMAVQHGWDPEKSKKGPLIWRPFQLAFILLAVTSTVDRKHEDRRTMDLLWFPTGGGKTEAYLMLIAVLAFYRRLMRLKDPDAGAGVAAVMRYTLRLLTTQQFIRAAAMIMACEAIRRGTIATPEKSQNLGRRPFSIGLWVGGDATPNTFEDAMLSLRGAQDKASPKQLLSCPACHELLTWNEDQVRRAILVSCQNRKCVLWDASENLPVWTVDEDVYREKPTLVIGTIDKFAQIVRRKETNALFGISAGVPPDLILQDELHLISGPLGTIAALYETAFDIMLSRDNCTPKVIGSTATIRRAPDQVRALFFRDTCQFPPAGIDFEDSGFAVVDRSAPSRLYVGVTTAGRSAKFTLQAVSGSLLQSATSLRDEEAKDPYWTLVAYFNSLRELGGAWVLMQDDVADAIDLYSARRGEESRGSVRVEELTSRRTQEEVRDMLAMLEAKVRDGNALDVVLATNMLSVGVDIPRLGLMVVNGQPKGTAEYVQATSRVGRGEIPGLVVSVLNNAKARDRSHFEAFPTWHATLYRDVEATSVTPFASRARDRALHAILVATGRHMIPGLLDSPAVADAMLSDFEKLIRKIVERARGIDPEETAVASELAELLRRWRNRSPRQYWNDYQTKQSLLQSAERVATLRAVGRSPGNAWPTPNNMRSVEAAVPFRMTERLRGRP